MTDHVKGELEGKKFGIYADLEKYKDIDEDAILATLTEEELKILEAELDPENELLPASERCMYKMEKTPKGKFDRQALVDYMEKKAREEADLEDNVPYKAGEKRGKVYKPKISEQLRKEEEKNKNEEDINLGEEWEEALKNATEEDLVDLAGVLGLHSMLNQEQYNASQRNEKLTDSQGKFMGVAKFTPPKLMQRELENDTDPDAALKQLKDSDPALKDLNLNNIRNIPHTTLIDMCETLGSNTTLESLSMASTRCNDSITKPLCESLKTNKVLLRLNVESNFISAQGVRTIMQAMRENETLQEIRLANQRGMLGQRVETEIAQILEGNTTVLKFGLSFDHANPRTRAHDAVMRNNEIMRKSRIPNGN